ncbi:MAG: hypothetical protein QOK48_1022 [Blastocatellia bacterium]|jgi:hypothetical protein|nr:hypothetical protein [Blastocatellia bacterium]
MKLYNNTQDQVIYTISDNTSDNCGVINAGDTADEPSFDNTQGVTVAFSNNVGGQLNIFIAEPQQGMTVTVGIYFE